MATISNPIESDITLVETTNLLGSVVGAVIIFKGATLQLRETVAGEVRIEAGAEAFIHGTVDGNVVNQGGYVRIFGTINGKVVEQAGVTCICECATVRDR